MEITGNITMNDLRSDGGSIFYNPAGAFNTSINEVQNTVIAYYSSQKRNRVNLNFKASDNWTGTTNTAQPQTVNLGSGQALDITPSYYTVHMWLRTS